MTEKKGDMMDGMLFFGKENSDPIQFSDYPETVVATLRYFYINWKIPSYIIPSKKSKSKFEEWVLQLQDLNNICPNTDKMKIAMENALERYERSYNKFPVIRPASIRTLLITVISELNREQERTKSNTATQDVSPEIPVKVASVKSRKNLAKQLKNFIKD